jgi:protein farnesyltransferase/geranylgeranyltransferase type-1 subunit alpha
MDELCFQYMKYYQVWSHRKLLLLLPSTLPAAIADTLSPIPPTPAHELTYLSRILSTDAKNYHTWAYRQWVLTYYGDTHPNLWEHELIATDLLIEDDVRNNSAWHHRFFISFASGAQSDVTDRELAFVKSKISLAPNNLSAWNYLRGILDKFGIKYATLRTFAELYSVARVENGGATKVVEGAEGTVEEADVEVYDLDNPRPSLTAELPCALAIEFMADLCEQEGEYDNAAEVWFHRL